MFNPSDRSVENRQEADELDPSGGYDDGEFARFEDCDEYDASDDFESGINYDEYPEFDE